MFLMSKQKVRYLDGSTIQKLLIGIAQVDTGLDVTIEFKRSDK